MQTVLDVGVEPERIIYSQPCKQNSHLLFARRCGIRKTVFDGADELHKIKHLHPNAELFLRIATDDSSGPCPMSAKFGAHETETQSLLETARDLGLHVVGVSFHIGTGAIDPQIFDTAVRDSRRVFDQAQECGFNLQILDVGGGFSVERFEDMSHVLSPALADHFPRGVEFIAEPGRYYVTSAFTAACCIIARKKKSREDDQPAYMLTLSDGLYGSLMDCMLSNFDPPTRVLSLSNEASVDKPVHYTLWGPTCDGMTDRIVEDMALPHLLNVGDWLYFPGMGAYTLCLATGFNGFPSDRAVHYISTEPRASELLGYVSMPDSTSQYATPKAAKALL
ncbi:MAG: hypothetical protein Q9183_005593 [Haloplaca sp. 2 TL-2023]